jgi:hypothetical protein
VHEVGHQGASLLDLVTTLRAELQQRAAREGADAVAWQMYERWISEIVADVWSVARVGVASTLGLIGVVSLPRAFVFRVSPDDPHPIPWIRVLLSARIGMALYPSAQWSRIASVWTTLYPLEPVRDPQRALINVLLKTIDEFVMLMLQHRSPSLRGQPLGAVLRSADRSPDALSATWRAWQQRPRELRRAPPTLLFAVVGQARANGQITPETESLLVRQHLARWAASDALRTSSARANARVREALDRRSLLLEHKDIAV